MRCTIQECGKWRKLQEMDPSQVEIFFIQFHKFKKSFTFEK